MNSTPEQSDMRSERSSWLRTLYQIAHSDTRWAKEQGWRVVNWTLLLFGALLGLAKYLNPQISPIAFSFIYAVILIAAIIYLVELHCWAKDTRSTSARIEEEIPDVEGILITRTYDLALKSLPA